MYNRYRSYRIWKFSFIIWMLTNYIIIELTDFVIYIYFFSCDLFVHDSSFCCQWNQFTIFQCIIRLLCNYYVINHAFYQVIPCNSTKTVLIRMLSIMSIVTGLLFTLVSFSEKCFTPLLTPSSSRTVQNMRAPADLNPCQRFTAVTCRSSLFIQVSGLNNNYTG